MKITLTRTSIRRWLRQPTTVAGLMGVAAGACALALHAPLTESAPLVIGGIVGLIFPDETTKQTATTRVLAEAVEALARRQLAAALPQILQDAEAAAVVDMAAAPKASAPIPVTAIGEPANGPACAPGARIAA